MTENNHFDKNLLNLAFSYFKQNKNDEAIAVFEQLLNQVPNEKILDILSNISLFKKSSNPKDYESCLKSVLSLFPFSDYSISIIFYNLLTILLHENSKNELGHSSFLISRKLKKKHLTYQDIIDISKRNDVFAKEFNEKTFYKISIFLLKKELRKTKRQNKIVELLAKISLNYLECDDFLKSKKYLKLSQKLLPLKSDLFYAEKLLEKSSLFVPKHPDLVAEYKKVLNYILSKYDKFNAKQYIWIAESLWSLSVNIQDDYFYNAVIFFYKKAIRRIKNYKKCTDIFAQIQLIYYKIGKYYFAKGYINLANKYIKDKNQLTINKQCLGELYFLMKKYTKAIEIFSELLEYTDVVEKAYIYLKLAEIYKETNDLPKAEFYISSAISLNTQNNELKETIETFYKNLKE